METVNKHELKNPFMGYRNKKDCAICGQEFEPKNIRGVYCSPLCRWRAYSLKKAGQLMGIGSDTMLWQQAESSHSTTFDMEQSHVPQTETNANQRTLTENPTHTNGEQTETNADQRKPTEIATETNANQLKLTEVATETNADQRKPTENIPATFSYNGSGFTDAIAEIVNERGLDAKFSNPRKYWNTEQADALVKINTCLRCLFSNTLYCSRRKRIESADLRDLVNAYCDVVNSPAFQSVVHPYREIIISLCRKISNYYRQYRNKPKLRLVLRRQDKIEIIAMLHEIGNSVPKHSFWELFCPVQQAA